MKTTRTTQQPLSPSQSGTWVGIARCNPALALDPTKPVIIVKVVR